MINDVTLDTRPGEEGDLPMQEALRSASTEDLYQLVDALLVAANYGNNWDAHGALPAGSLQNGLGCDGSLPTGRMHST
jgi:hypothetical protein